MMAGKPWRRVATVSAQRDCVKSCLVVEWPLQSMGRARLHGWLEYHEASDTWGRMHTPFLYVL